MIAPLSALSCRLVSEMPYLFIFGVHTHTHAIQPCLQLESVDAQTDAWLLGLATLPFSTFMAMQDCSELHARMLCTSYIAINNSTVLCPRDYNNATNLLCLLCC